MAAGTCFICEKLVEKDQKTRIPRKKSIQSLISVSIERQDNKHYKYKLKNKECVTVHEKCYKSYISAGNVKACKRRKETQIGPVSTCATTSNFGFEKNCLLCGKDASGNSIKNQSKKKNSPKRQYVRNVTAEQLEKIILRRAGERSDKWGNEVLNRITSVTSLIAARARYHAPCYLRFFASNSKPATEQLSSEQT